MNQIKGLILGAILSLSFGICRADSKAIGAPWSGLNNADTAIQINDNEAQDLSNVDITESGAGMRKRSGYAQFRTIGASTEGVRGAYYYRNSALADLLIHANARGVFKSANSGAYSAFITTTTNGSYWDFADSLGYLYGANNNNDELWRYDGTTLTWFPSHVKGDQVEFTSNRFVISGGTTNPKRVTFCKASDPTDCATSSDQVDAFTEDLDMPGQRVTAIKYACGGILAYTKDAMAIVTAQDQYDLSPTDILSKTIGTIQPHSVVNDLGVTYWQGTDRHFYSYDCNGIRKISSKLDVSGIVSGEIRNWTTNSQSDFEAGTVGTGLSSTESPGDVIYTTGTLIDNFTDGDYTASPVWTAFGVSNSTITITSNQLKFTQSVVGSNAQGGLYTPWTFPNGVGIQFSIAQLEEGDSGGQSQVITLSFLTSAPTGIRSLHLPDGTSTYNMSIARDGSGVLIQISSAGFNTGTEVILSSAIFSAGGSVPTTVELFRSTAGFITALANGSVFLSVTDTTYQSFSYLSINGTAEAGITSAKSEIVDNFYVKYASATFQTQMFNIGTSISSWGTLDMGSSDSGGVHSFAIYGDTDTNITITNAATFSSSQTITSGSIPTIATAPYVMLSDYFTRTVSTNSPSLSESILHYNEGSTLRVASAYPNQRYHLAVAISSTSNNRILVYDRNKEWQRYSGINATAMGPYNSNWYFANANGIFQMETGNDDDGAAISAYYYTPAYFPSQSLDLVSVFHDLIVTTEQSDETLTTTFRVDGAGTAYTLGAKAMNSTTGFQNFKLPFPFTQLQQGKYIDFKFAVSGTTPWRVLNANLYTMPDGFPK